MNKVILTALVSLALMAGVTLANPSQVLAACHTVYGGGEVCDQYDFSLDKVVYNPNGKHWQDNVDSSSYTFGPGEEVKFELRVKNIGDHKIKEITLRDILPSYLEYVSGGSWDSNDKTAEFKIYNLEPGKTQTQTVFVKTVAKNKMPEGVTCVTNKAEVYVKDDGSATDTSTLCMKKGDKVLGTTTLPATGPSAPLVLVLEITALAGMGVAYLKIARK